MLKKIILLKYQKTQLYYYLTAKKVKSFYANALTQPKIPHIPYTFLHHTNHLMVYLWDIHEELEVLESIGENTQKLQQLYRQFQSMLDYAI